jgi:hypothetical protein
MIERPPLGTDPAEGRDDLGLPGADRAGDGLDLPRPDRHGEGNPETERRDDLADRVENGQPGAAGSTDSDLRPDVEVPDEQM